MVASDARDWRVFFFEVSRASPMGHAQVERSRISPGRRSLSGLETWQSFLDALSVHVFLVLRQLSAVLLDMARQATPHAHELTFRVSGAVCYLARGLARDWWSALVSFASSFALAAVLAAFAQIINFLIQLLFLGQEASNSSLLG